MFDGGLLFCEKCNQHEKCNQDLHNLINVVHYMSVSVSRTNRLECRRL